MFLYYFSSNEHVFNEPLAKLPGWVCNLQSPEVRFYNIFLVRLIKISNKKVIVIRKTFSSRDGIGIR